MAAFLGRTRSGSSSSSSNASSTSAGCLFVVVASANLGAWTKAGDVAWRSPPLLLDPRGADWPGRILPGLPVTASPCTSAGLRSGSFGNSSSRSSHNSNNNSSDGSGSSSSVTSTGGSVGRRVGHPLFKMFAALCHDGHAHSGGLGAFLAPWSRCFSHYQLEQVLST